MAEPSLHSFVAGDGYSWRYRRFEVAGESRGEIVVLHGIQSHGGWYDISARSMADSGFNVSLLDRRGSGMNEQDRGDAPSFRRLLDDVAEYMTTLPRPRVLIGISWGGKLAVATQRRHPGLTDGLILISPGFCPRRRHTFGERMQILASRFVAPRREFRIPLNEPGLFTSNPERQQFIRDDPLSLHRATVRLFFESARMDVYLRFARSHVAVPTLVLLAEQDRIIDNARTRRYVEDIRSIDRAVIEYRGAHHTLEFEPGGPPYLSDLRVWLSRFVAQNSTEPEA